MILFRVHKLSMKGHNYKETRSHCTILLLTYFLMVAVMVQIIMVIIIGTDRSQGKSRRSEQRYRITAAFSTYASAVMADVTN